jgi:hypothetical protein
VYNDVEFLLLLFTSEYNLPPGRAPSDFKPFFPSVFKNNGYFMGFVGTSSWRFLGRSGWLSMYLIDS